MDQRPQKTLVIALVTVFLTFFAAQTMAQSTDSEAQSETSGLGTSIFATRTMPKGLTIMPWKDTDMGQLKSEPIRQIDKPLQPIDPAEFRRRLTYYQQSGAE